MKFESNARSAFLSLKTAVSRCTTVLLLLPFAIALSAGAASAQTGLVGIFGGGPFYNNAANHIGEIRNSGFTEAIVWSVEVRSNGDLNLNGDFPLTSNGSYIGNQKHPDFPGSLASLKQGTVRRITFSIGSSNVGDWQDVQSLVTSQGTGPNSVLFKDFQALKQAIPAVDAIDFDDENNFDATTTIQFAVMLGNLGYHVMPDAFDNSGYWKSLVSQINSQRPGTVDGVHVQAYAGGAGNNPCSGWNFGAVPVYAGLWDRNDTPSQVHSIMSSWHSQCGITGGFMWLYDDFVGNGLAAQYASAIHNAVGSPPPPPVLAINAGGPAVSPFAGDTDFAGGTTINHANSINLTGVTNPAPMQVYQTARIGNFTYTIPGFAAGSSHTVQLHFAETYWTAAGKRKFNVSINETQVLTNFDIFAAAGAMNKAVIQQFTGNANGSGQYVIQFTSVLDKSLVSGIEVQ
ncbi:MAG TPA: malectin domain-containing carbohydrate-binding protein [Terriglobales bacterium]|jgi:hypothetical protein|nr:malectin domain-containing carbohydrate-binding protein [Terriglobales bacterium]